MEYLFRVGKLMSFAGFCWAGADPVREGGPMDTMGTLPMEVLEHAHVPPHEGASSSSATVSSKAGDIPMIADPPAEMVGGVLRQMWAKPMNIQDPTLQHKKQFRMHCQGQAVPLNPCKCNMLIAQF